MYILDELRGLICFLKTLQCKRMRIVEIGEFVWAEV